MYSLLRPLLFRMDPEVSHHVSMAGLRALGWLPGGVWPQPGSMREVMGLRFANPVGLAAGLDKDAEAVEGLARLGFGFVEVGTVTPRPQPGNPRPRLFRLPEALALINRMGFNNDGADAMAKRFENADPGIPVGINLGKSKITELSDAPEDYAYSFKLLKDFGDYVSQETLALGIAPLTGDAGARF